MHHDGPDAERGSREEKGDFDSVHELVEGEGWE